MVALGYNIVIFLLMLLYNRLYRNPCEYRFPLHQKQRLPHPPHTSITISKRMNEFKFIVKHARTDKRMNLCILYPRKQLSHQRRNPAGWRCHMHTSVSTKYTHPALSVSSTFTHQIRHHQTMCTQQIFLLIRIQLHQQLIRVNGILHFPYLIWCTQHSFSSNNSGHLIQRK